MTENDASQVGLRRSPRLAALRLRAKAKHRHLVPSTSSPVLCLPPERNPTKTPLTKLRTVSSSVVPDVSRFQHTLRSQKRKRASPDVSPDIDCDSSIIAPKKSFMLPRRLAKKRRESTSSYAPASEGFVRFGSFNRKKRRERDEDDNISCQSLQIEPTNYDEGDGDNLSIASYTMVSTHRPD
ncbi:uncharacterized protein [Amphiura filiformis]|uniref:uncharacterized protein n=1 Tax=Amphiura filiformis TaxID=82378 RepID=UPI003B20DC67